MEEICVRTRLQLNLEGNSLKFSDEGEEIQEERNGHYPLGRRSYDVLWKTLIGGKNTKDLSKNLEKIYST